MKAALKFICVHAVTDLVRKTVIACTHMKCKGLISDDFRPFFFLASFGFFFPHKENACDACRSSGNREKKNNAKGQWRSSACRSSGDREKKNNADGQWRSAACRSNGDREKKKG